MERYKRNILLEGFGEEGQEKLRQGKVLVIGAGGLGSPVLFYLAAAGVGTIGIVDFDVVDITNLQRQILHQTTDLGKQKAISAKEKLEALNPEITIKSYVEKLTVENAVSLINEYDFVIECCDNYEAKFLVNDVCVAQGKPYSHGAILAMQGEVMTYTPGHACYRCVFGNAPKEGSVPSAAQAGVLGSIAGIAGSIQASEAIKYLTGIGELLTNRLLIFDGKNMTFNSLKVNKRNACGCDNV